MAFKNEGEMYQPIKEFFINRNPNRDSLFGYDSHKGLSEISGWPLHLNKFSINPDVYGIGEQKKTFLCQGKCIIKKNNSFSKNKIWELVGQTISNVKYGNYIYIFIDKKGYINLKNNNYYFQEFISILKRFNIGLLSVDEENHQVEEIIIAIDQDIPQKRVEDTSEKIRKALKSESIVKGVAKRINNEIDIETSEFKITGMGKNRPSIYIYLDEWYKNKKISYLVKFLVDGVRIGINIDNPAGERSIESLFNLSHNKQLEKVIEKNTKEIFILKKQNYDELIREINSKRGQEVISEICEELLNIIKKNDPHLKSLYNTTYKERESISN